MRLSLAFVVGSLTLAATSANAWVMGYCDANLRWRTEISMIGGLSSNGRTAQSTSIPTQLRDAYAQNVATTGSPINSAAPQEAFTATVQQAKSNYEAAANDMAKGGVRVSRKESLCRILASFDIENWQGEIHTLSSNSEGKGVVKIVIAPDIYLKTWDNSLSDGDDQTLIDPDTDVFKIFSKMQKGDRIRFSGRFLTGDDDCIKEGSVTQRGSMVEPEFIIRFSAVAPQ